LEDEKDEEEGENMIRSASIRRLRSLCVFEHDVPYEEGDLCDGLRKAVLEVLCDAVTGGARSETEDEGGGHDPPGFYLV
jgi:hypothetical protein